MNPSDPRHDWLQQYADGTATADTTARLDAALREDAEFRALFLDYMNLDCALHALGAARTTMLRVPSPRRAIIGWLAAAAALTAVLFSLKVYFLDPGKHSHVAMLRRAIGVTWEDADHAAGESLKPGWLRLRTGIVQIDFSSGARVVLAGPAEFQIASGNTGVLKRGRLLATVPKPAHGFTIRGEGFSVVDRGTEFGVVAGEKPEVHVFTGRVELARATISTRVLDAGNAVRMNESGWFDMPADRTPFTSLEEVSQLERREAWKRAAATLDSHPSALVHYDFERASGQLLNRVPRHEIPASVAGCLPTEGRWPWKAALAFKSAEDRVRFTVPGQTQSLTLLAWVRVDALPNTQSSLLMGESELPGEVHWYVHGSGVIGLAVIGPDNRWRSVHTPVVLWRPDFGRWNFFAVTFDGATRVATHYLNGKPLASGPLDTGGPLRLRTVEIGNWGLRPGAKLRASTRVAAEPGGYVRNLRGCVDEFAIFSAPLSAQEILRIYETGKPPAAAPLTR